MNASRTSEIDVTTALIAIIAFLLGMLAGIVLLISAQVREVQRQAAAEPLKPTSELLGEVAVDMGPGSPNHALFEEAKADDRLRALNERDEAH